MNFRIILRPKTSIKPARKIEPAKVSLESFQPSFGWILSGSPSNWRVAFERNIWGVKPKHITLWQQVSVGDILFLYATRPVSGLVGIARVTRTVKNEKPYWPDEIRSGMVKYPYRIEFRPVKILDNSDWSKKRISIRHLGPIYFQGINPIKKKEIFTNLTQLTTRLRR